MGLDGPPRQIDMWDGGSTRWLGRAITGLILVGGAWDSAIGHSQGRRMTLFRPWNRPKFLALRLRLLRGDQAATPGEMGRPRGSSH